VGMVNFGQVGWRVRRGEHRGGQEMVAPGQHREI